MVSKINLKSVTRIETGEVDTGAETDNKTALQTVTDDLVDEFDTATGHYHDGTDAKKIPSGEVVVDPMLFGADSVYSTLYFVATALLATAGNPTGLSLYERSTDPDEPTEGKFVVWMSDGTGKGDDGDILIASQAGGVTKYSTLFDHSAGGAW